MDPSGKPWKPENTVKYKGLATFHVALRKPPRTPKSAPGRSRNDSQEAPRSGRGRPRKAQEAPRRPQESPGAPQERPKSRLKSASERPGRPNEAHQASKSPPEASRRPFLDPHGAFFHPPGNNRNIILTGRCVFHNCPVCKAYASIRPASHARACVTSTCVCNFCMWISAATDRESRSTNPCIGA